MVAITGLTDAQNVQNLAVSEQSGVALPTPTPQPESTKELMEIVTHHPKGVERWISESPDLARAYTIPNVTDIALGGHFIAVLNKDGKKAKLKCIDIRTGKETVLKKRMKYREKDRVSIIEGRLLHFDHGDHEYLWDLKTGKQILKFDASDFYTDLIPLSKYYYAKRDRIPSTLKIVDFEGTQLREIDLANIDAPVWGCQNLAAIDKGSYIEVHAVANRLPKQYLACAQEMKKHLGIEPDAIKKLSWLPVERKASHFAVQVDYLDKGERKAAVLIYNKEFRYAAHHSFTPKSREFKVVPNGTTLLIQDGESFKKIDIETGQVIEKGLLDVNVTRPSIEVPVGEHFGRPVQSKKTPLTETTPITAYNGATALLRRTTGVLKINLKIDDIVHEKEIQLQPILDEHLKGAPLATQGVKLHMHGTQLVISTVDVQERSRQIFVLDVTDPAAKVDTGVEEKNWLCCF